MISYRVENMTCGHCVSTITAALTRVDAKAKVDIDLATRRVDIDSTLSRMDRFADAIRSAGYAPLAIAHPAAAQPDVPAKRSGCCCA